MLEYLSVGIILKPQGLKGEVKVKPLTDDEERFNSLRSVFIKNKDGYNELSVLSRRYDKGFVYLKFRGYDAIEAVEPLRNEYLWIPRKMARRLPEGSFFIADLIGCKVRTVTGEELGEIKDVLETGGNDVFVITGSKGEILIPALKKVVTQVDLDDGLMTVDLTDMEGLLPDED